MILGETRKARGRNQEERKGQKQQKRGEFLSPSGSLTPSFNFLSLSLSLSCVEEKFKPRTRIKGERNLIE